MDRNEDALDFRGDLDFPGVQIHNPELIHRAFLEMLLVRLRKLADDSKGMELLKRAVGLLGADDSDDATKDLIDDAVKHFGQVNVRAGTLLKYAAIGGKFAVVEVQETWDADGGMERVTKTDTVEEQLELQKALIQLNQEEVGMGMGVGQGMPTEVLLEPMENLEEGMAAPAGPEPMMV